MRGLTVLTALLVLLAPLAAAQSGSESGSSSSSSTGPSGSGSSSSTSGSSSSSTSSGPSGNATAEPEDAHDEDEDDVACPLPERRPMSEAEKRACYCERSDDPRFCASDEADDAEAEAADREAGEWRRWCREEARADAQRERCRQALEDFGDDLGRDRRVTFRVDAANRTLLDYAIDGKVVLAAIALDPGSDNLTVQRAGSTLRLGDADSELVLHDDPSGLVRFKGADGSVTVRLAPGAAAGVAADGSVARVTFADGSVGHLRLGNATWIDGETVLAAGFFAFLLPPGQEPRPGSASDAGADDDGDGAAAAEVQEKLGRAITRSRVGAEISVKAPAPAAASTLAAEESTVDVLAYDDVEVEVNVPSEAATPDAPIRVKVSAELDEGRTIVLKLDRSVLESAKPGALVLRYYDLYSQPDGTEVQTEVLFAEAAGLEDVLDPSDDSGQPEYWVVEDANGLQVLVSVPHWSAHAVTIGSILASNPSVLAGILVGLAGSAVAAAAMLWPRRREDDE